MRKREFFESDMIKKFVSNPLNNKVALHELNKYCNYLIENGYNETEHAKLEPAITSRVYEAFDVKAKSILVVTDYDNMVNYFRLQLETIHNEINEYIKQNNNEYDYTLYYWYADLAKVSHILADLSTYMDFQKKKLYRIVSYTNENYKLYDIETLDYIIKHDGKEE